MLQASPILAVDLQKTGFLLNGNSIDISEAVCKFCPVMNMTGRERMLMPQSLGQPDRVPVWELPFKEDPQFVKDLARVSEEYIFSYHAEMVSHIHRHGMKAIKHSDGVMWPIMDHMVEAGFDGMHPIQPQCMDITQAKAKYGKRICIMGNIDCTHLLPTGTTEEVEKAVRDTMAVAAPAAAISPVHPIPSTRPAKLKTTWPWSGRRANTGNIPI